MFSRTTSPEQTRPEPTNFAKWLSVSEQACRIIATLPRVENLTVSHSESLMRVYALANEAGGYYQAMMAAGENVGDLSLAYANHEAVWGYLKRVPTRLLPVLSAAETFALQAGVDEEVVAI